MNPRLFYVLLFASFAASGLAHYARWPNTLQFLFSVAAILLVASFLGKATESVAHYAGERVGGFLSATFGNAAELIIAIFLVRAGLFDMVKASITGSIIGNLLLVFGLSVFVGGMRYKVQRFNQTMASHNASLQTIAVIALFIPALFVTGITPHEMNRVSLAIALILIVAYLLWLYFSMVTHRSEFADEEVEHGSPPWGKSASLFNLALATVMVAFASEWLVHTLDPLAKKFGLSELFLGAFVIAIIGNAAEHSAAVMLAAKNKIGAAMEIAIGSSLQIALFVAPVLIFVSFLFGHPMNIVFSGYEIAAIAVSVFISKSISQDGATNWYEGVMLLVVYVILAVVFFYV